MFILFLFTLLFCWFSIVDMKYISKSAKDTAAAASNILNKEIKKKRSGALVFGLYGDLGAGKTAFVKETARLLGVKGVVTSPTFVILKKYKIKDSVFKNLIHIDAYRLESAKDLEQLDWNMAVKNPTNIIFIEWADRVENALPKNTARINFEFIDERTRKIKII